MGGVDQEAGVVQEEEEKEEVRRCGRGVAIQSSRRSRKRKRQSRQKDRYGSFVLYSRGRCDNRSRRGRSSSRRRGR